MTIDEQNLMLEGELDLIEIVEQDGMALQYASERLQNDPDVVMTAVKQNGRAIQWASDRLKNNFAVSCCAVTQTGYALQFVSDELRNNKDVVMMAVKQDGRAIQWASDKLKNDPNVVLEAVARTRDALRFVGNKLRYDPDVVAVADGEKSISMVKQQYTKNYLKINHFIDDEVSSIALIPLNKIISVEYFDDKIELATYEKRFFYSFYDVEFAVKFIEEITQLIDNFNNRTIKELHYYQYTKDGSKSKVFAN